VCIPVIGLDPKHRSGVRRLSRSVALIQRDDAERREASLMSARIPEDHHRTRQAHQSGTTTLATTRPLAHISAEGPQSCHG